jgi:hypothetical protein
MEKPRQEATGQKHTRHEAAGVAVELLIKSILINKGFLVSDPILSTSYDFITEWDGIINTIQVRSTATAAWRGYYRIETPKRGGYSILLAHIAPRNVTFVMPWNEVDRQWICIHKDRLSRYEKYKEKWNLLKETH